MSTIRGNLAQAQHSLLGQYATWILRRTAAGVLAQAEELDVRTMTISSYFTLNSAPLTTRPISCR